MLGAGIVLLIFGVIALLTGKSLSGGGGDVFALIEVPFYIAGIGLSGLGLVLCFAGA